jgi:hypothetical protein
MNIQAKTNEELRTKLSNYFKRKFYGSNRKLRQIVANENFLFKIKEKDMQPN